MESLFKNIDPIIQANPFLALAVVFAAGVLVSFTPCVYPVIPVTLGYIGARSVGSRWRGFFLSVFYVFGMALTYAALGAFASLSGKLFGQIGSSPVTYFIVANVYLILGLSMLGVLQVPQISLGGGARAQKKGSLIGAVVIGMFSGLIVGPCTAPVLAALLVYVGGRQNIPYGFLLLFIFGYGVGFLMIILGTFAGLLGAIPKSGVWLERIKKGFGWVMIFAAQYLLIVSGRLSI